MISKRNPRRAPHRPYVREPAAEPITIERAVEEGLLIVRSALTMEIKNRIIVSALRDDRPFDAAEAATWVGLELEHLSREQADYAKRMNHLAVTVKGARGPKLHTHDYGPRDYRSLTRRGMAYSALSAELERLESDADFVSGVVEDARGRAWSELGGAIVSRLDLVPAEPPPDPDYAVGRDARLRSFVEVDLANLSALSGY
jgi:hypothetical protein